MTFNFGLLRLFLFFLPQQGDGLSTGEAGVQLVPVRDALFAQLPAEIDIASVVAGDKIDQSAVVVLNSTPTFDSSSHSFLSRMTERSSSPCSERRFLGARGVCP